LVEHRLELDILGDDAVDLDPRHLIGEAAYGLEDRSGIEHQAEDQRDEEPLPEGAAAPPAPPLLVEIAFERIHGCEPAITRRTAASARRRGCRRARRRRRTSRTAPPPASPRRSRAS